MKQFEHSKDFIEGWYIDTDLCDTIMSQAEQDISVFRPSNRPYSLIDLGQFNYDLGEHYCRELFKVLDAYKRLYPWCYSELQKWGFTRPQIQRYNPGDYYNFPHCENDGRGEYVHRHLVFMTYLNDIKDGGGTEFIQQGLITPAQKGLTVIWPAGWTHYHRGVVAPKEVKYIITGWCVFDSPKQ